MNSDSLSWRFIIYSVVLTMLISASCSVPVTTEATPALIPTSLPERLQLIGGEIDPCLLINSEEVETVLGVKVTSEEMYIDYMPSCKYFSTTNNQPILLFVSAVTDVSIKKANQPWLKEGNVPISAAEAYERERMIMLMRSEFNKFKDIDNLGDQAFLYETISSIISVLKNNIFYQFTGRTDHGVDHDTLIKLIEIGLERMP